MTTLITSLNAKLFSEYGQRMLDGFAKYSQGVKLIVVFEGDIPSHVPLKQGPVQIVELKSEEFSRFHLFFGNLFEAHGLKLTKHFQPGGETLLRPVYNYRFNLIRFAFKIFSIDIARALLPAGEPFAWIDADVNCLRPFSDTDLRRFFPDECQIMSYLGRTHFPPDAPYSECGFLGFNPHHSQIDPFLYRMKSLYLSGEAFRFREWHDSWLWDEVRKEFEQMGFKFKNISGNSAHVEHPFVVCGLGQFFDHLKGPQRKKIGKSSNFDRLNGGRPESGLSRSAVDKSVVGASSHSRRQDLVAYGCGSPIRLRFVEALSKGAGARLFVPDPNPQYQGGHSIVWGLIRGAPEIMQMTREAGFDFYQMDNAYFGRDIFHRVTCNNLQITNIYDCDSERLDAIFQSIGFSFSSWKSKRSGPIVLCPSSEWLFDFYGMSAQEWVDSTTAKIRRFSDRPIIIREKQLVGIEEAVSDAWCVVTHVSAAALDALRLGIPVVTTAKCAATPLATPIEEIEKPWVGMDRRPLFSTLAWGQFSLEEMANGFAWEALQRFR